VETLVDVRADDGWLVAPGTVTPWGSWELVGEWHRPPVLPATVTRELASLNGHANGNGEQAGSWRRYLPAQHADRLHPLTTQAHGLLVERYGVAPNRTTFHEQAHREPWLQVTRPGKTGGTSASLGCVGPGVVKVFSSGWPGLQARTYSLDELAGGADSDGGELAQDTDDELAEIVFRREASAEAHRLRVRAEATRIVTEERSGRQEPPDHGTLAEMLARPATDRWRIDGLLPAEAGMLRRRSTRPARPPCSATPPGPF
jgi:hypothetical protein